MLTKVVDIIMNKKILITVLYLILSSAVSAIGIYYFIYPSDFAPIGIDGIAMMIHELTGLSAAYFIIGLNLPLLVLSLIFLDKRFTVLTILNIVLTSLFLLALEKIDFPQYETETDKLLPAIFSGVLLGLRTGLLLKIGASSGGVDIVAGIISKKNPFINFERYISLICYVIIVSSFAVYKNLECIMLSLIQMFVFEKTAAMVMQNLRNAVEFKIITDHPELLKEDIISNLKHGATVVESKGMFTGENKSMIFCVVNTRQVPEFMKILKKYDHLFVYSSEVSSVNGNFRWRKEDIAK